MSNGIATHLQVDRSIANVDAERALVGCILFQSSTLDDVADLVGTDDFWNPQYRQIFSTCQYMRAKGKPIDALTVNDEIARSDSRVDFDNLPLFLAEIIEDTAHAAHAGYYATLIRDASMVRKTHEIANNIATRCRSYKAHHDVQDVLTEAEQHIHGCLEAIDGSGDAESFADLMIDTLHAIDNPAPLGISSGFQMFDKMSGQLRPGNMIILAARPSSGKTAYAGNIAIETAKLGNKVLFFSLEQSRLELSLRFLAYQSHIDTNLMRDKTLDDVQREMVMDAAAELSKLPVMIDDRSGITAQQIAAKARLTQRKFGVDLIIVDYLQFVEPSSKKENREQQIATISRQLKNMAKQLGVPVIVLAQLNRAAVARTNKTPILSDLRESGSIEQDADIVAFIHRPWTYDTMQPKGQAKLVVAKNRDGETGTIFMDYRPHLLTFVERAHPFDEDDGHDGSRYETGGM